MQTITDQNSVRATRPRLMIARLCWLLPFLAVPLAAFVAFVGIVGASGAPQQGAAAAIACLICIGPYVFARAFEEIIRD